MIDDDKNETITSLLHTIALIREAAGVGEKPMLSELPDVIRKLRKERDELRCEVCDWVGNHFKEPPQDVAKRNGWDCFDTGVWDCYKEKSK